MGTVGFLLGGLLGRVAGPVALDWFENNTEMGRKMKDQKIMDKKQEYTLEREHRGIVREQEYKEYLKRQAVEFKQKMIQAENQHVLALQSWNQQNFFQNCFPLRNPYDMPLGVILQEGVPEHPYTLQTTILENGKQVMPLRVITALTSDMHPQAETVNSELSSFLVTNYPVNSIHGVLSEIGAWKDGFPVNDASINYLFMGLKGQPAIVIAPNFINEKSMERIKVWSWGLGEDLAYPVGFDCGWIDLNLINRKLVIIEVKKAVELNKKIDHPLSLSMKQAYTIIESMEKLEDKLSEDEKNNLIRQVPIPNEIRPTALRQLNGIVSQVYICLTSMFADGHHLMEYGTRPLLPSLFSNMKDIYFLAPYVRDYYISLLNVALEKKQITWLDVCKTEIELAQSINNLGCTIDVYERLIEDSKSMMTILIDIPEYTDQVKNLNLICKNLKKKNLNIDCYE